MHDDNYIVDTFYKLENASSAETKFVTCTIPEESPYFYTWWTSGKPLQQDIVEPIIYHVYDHSGPVEDFPFTNAGQFLVSERLYQLLKESGAKFDSYKSSILIEDTGKCLNNFYTINFTESYSVLNRDMSDYIPDPDNPDLKVRTIIKLVIKSSSVPSGIDIFKLAESRVVTLVTDRFRRMVIKKGVSGVDFKLIESS